MPEDVTPEPEETVAPAEDAEVVAHSDDEELEDWCVFNNSAL
jgi:hypothetical protein